MRHLLSVAIERQSLDLRCKHTALSTDSSLSCLTPARMVDLWVDIGIEAILIRG